MTNFGSILGEVLKNYANNVPQSPAEVQDVSHQDAYNHYQQVVQQASPQQLQEAHQQALQQLPPNERENLFNQLLGALTQHGISPQQAGVQGNNPSPQNLSQIVQYITQNPNLMQSVFGKNGVLSSPLAKMVLVGALAMVAQRMSNRNKGMNKG
jgi:hypothetical protein